MTCSLVRERREKDTEEEFIFRWRRRLEPCGHKPRKPRNRWSHQKLEEASKDSFLEPPVGVLPC